MKCTMLTTACGPNGNAIAGDEVNLSKTHPWLKGGFAVETASLEGAREKRQARAAARAATAAGDEDANAGDD